MPGSTELPLIQNARRHLDRIALQSDETEITYAALLESSAAVAGALLGTAHDLEEGRVAFLVGPDTAYVSVQWGIWRAGGVAVPLATSHPPRELEYVLDDAEVVALVVDPEFEPRIGEAARARGIRVLRTPDILSEAFEAPGRDLPSVARSRRAMMLYTSGTTGRPKGVVTTHANLEAQVTSLVEAWGWKAEDRILLVLPLHHVHGIVNVLTCALWSGAACRMHARFDAERVWEALSADDLTLFMGVPTIYARLLAAWEAAESERQERWRRGAGRLRLMVSGSAALPVRILQRWQEITGHTLLERYGMTEIGMALSNPLDGERRPGFVGSPLPGVDVRLVDEGGEPVPEGAPGELRVRGPGVFLEYWRRPDETVAAFHDGWFATGDVAVAEDGAYRILGRQSVDILKTGGYKVSALEIEEILREHPAIVECAVVGVPDPEWGERVAAAIVPVVGSDLDPSSLREWARTRLAPYKIPSLIRLLADLPRNAMGKVTKPSVRSLFETDMDPAAPT